MKASRFVLGIAILYFLPCCEGIGHNYILRNSSKNSVVIHCASETKDNGERIEVYRNKVINPGESLTIRTVSDNSIKYVEVFCDGKTVLRLVIVRPDRQEPISSLDLVDVCGSSK